MTLITLSKILPTPVEIRQSRLKRDWMDKTYKKHAYQCLPVTSANINGWEMVLPEDVVAIWDGTQAPAKIISGGQYNGWNFAHSNIAGMLSFFTGWAINTEDGYSLWTTGSPNFYLDGVQPMTANIPSSWWPDEVATNWIFTEKNKPVLFPKGMPFLFFTIYPDVLLPSVEFEIVNRWENKEMVKSREKYNNLKRKITQEKPWTWIKGIKTGTDADNNSIGPSYQGPIKLNEPFL